MKSKCFFQTQKNIKDSHQHFNDETGYETPIPFELISSHTSSSHNNVKNRKCTFSYKTDSQESSY